MALIPRTRVPDPWPPSGLPATTYLDPQSRPPPTLGVSSIRCRALPLSHPGQENHLVVYRWRNPICSATAASANGMVPKTWGNIPSRWTRAREAPAKSSVPSSAIDGHTLPPLERASTSHRFPIQWVSPSRRAYGDVGIARVRNAPTRELLRNGVPPNVREIHSELWARARRVEYIPVAGVPSSFWEVDTTN
jgi:hypothetical protein